MYFEPGRTPHGLPHDPFKSCVIPRPIGWISTVDSAGRCNLAPYSQFQNVTFDPPIVMFSANQTTDGRRKDSVRNAEDTGEFVWNMATWDLREAVNRTGEELPHGVDEFEHAGLAKLPSRKVRPQRVAGSPIQFECVYLTTRASRACRPSEPWTSCSDAWWPCTSTTRSSKPAAAWTS
jgi:flavin reductase (DIM6/NTAB) family NADH-FMN oxidoreductase RutF